MVDSELWPAMGILAVGVACAVRGEWFRWSCMPLAYVSNGGFISFFADPGTIAWVRTSRGAAAQAGVERGSRPRIINFVTNRSGG